MEKMKADSWVSGFKSKIGGACGGRRCGRADMIVSGRCDLRRGEALKEMNL